MSNISLTVVTQVRLYQIGDKTYSDPSFYKIVERYAQSFGKINLISRIIKTTERPSGYLEVTSCCAKCYNIGDIAKFLTKAPDKELQSLIKKSDLVVLRVPSLVSIKVYTIVKRYRKKYMTEVMGCAWDAYWNHGASGKVIALFAYNKMKQIVKNANYALYVTHVFLQNRYPSDGLSAGISDVDINSIDKPKSYAHFNKKAFTIMTAGAINVKYKGQEFVIKAIKTLKERDGIDIKYYLAGKGDSERLEKIAKREGVTDNVIILGMLSKEELAKAMRETDIYIQPSLQEGLPRSVVEAMSHGCVCIGANTGGIPELIDKKFIFKRKNSNSIVDAVTKCLNSSLSNESKRNTEKASFYKKDVLDRQRKDYYSKIARDIQNEKRPTQ